MCQRCKDGICAGRLLNLPGLLSLPPLYGHLEDRGFSVRHQKQTSHPAHRAGLAGTGHQTCCRGSSTHISFQNNHCSGGTPQPALSFKPLGRFVARSPQWGSGDTGYTARKRSQHSPRKCRYGCSWLHLLSMPSPQLLAGMAA